MTLALDLIGTRVAVGARFGDAAPVEHSFAYTTQTETSSKTSAKGALSLEASETPKANGSAGFAAEGSKAQDTKTQLSTNLTTQSVVAHPNDKWVISTHNRETALEAKYLGVETPICTIQPIKNANRNGLIVHLYAHKSDLKIEVIEGKKPLLGFSYEKKNKERVMTALLAKVASRHQEGLDTKSNVHLSSLRSPDVDAE